MIEARKQIIHWMCRVKEASKETVILGCLDQISEKRWQWCLGWGVSGVGGRLESSSLIGRPCTQMTRPQPRPTRESGRLLCREIGLQAACPEQSSLRQGTRRWCLHIPTFYCTELWGLECNFEVHITQSPLCNRWNPKKSSSLPKFLQLITKLEWEDSLQTYGVKLY